MYQRLICALNKQVTCAYMPCVVRCRGRSSRGLFDSFDLTGWSYGDYPFETPKKSLIFLKFLSNHRSTSINFFMTWRVGPTCTALGATNKS